MNACSTYDVHVGKFIYQIFDNRCSQYLKDAPHKLLQVYHEFFVLKRDAEKWWQSEQSQTVSPNITADSDLHKELLLPIDQSRDI